MINREEGERTSGSERDKAFIRRRKEEKGEEELSEFACKGSFRSSVKAETLSQYLLALLLLLRHALASMKRFPLSS
ncbi:hypothetical protein QN277_010497 [Acacia crassicarpa]|uniref:Uncharacterized protein n=1 Tax=Acacia crassicarpa TaxID=499986 RepID=A0AAE1IPT9_9FABA|nr:hypothetical protein QN277_010497 [Acacia crassicarpa]